MAPRWMVDDFLKVVARLPPVAGARKIKWRPASRWQALKDRCAPGWLLRRWPVRHVPDGHLEMPGPVTFSGEELAGHAVESGKVVDAIIRASAPLDITFGEAWDDPKCQELTLAEFKMLYGDPRGQLVAAGILKPRREGGAEPRGIISYKVGE